MMLLVVTLVSMVVISMFRKTADRKQGELHTYQRASSRPTASS